MLLTEHNDRHKHKAGITEHSLKDDDLTAYSEQALKAALALNLLFSPFYQMEGNVHRQIEPSWQQTLFQQKPELVQAVYQEIIEILLKNQKRLYTRGGKKAPHSTWLVPLQGALDLCKMAA